jgi:ABC-2 type transport system ATP-binding protein
VTAIATRGLSRTFRIRGSAEERAALIDVDLAVDHGEVRGLIGPNGAGKTTLCKILSTVMLPSSGTATICGHDVAVDHRAVQPLIGIVFGGDQGLYGRLSAAQNLRYWGALYGLHGTALRRRTDETLERVGLEAHAGRRVDTFSRGMKQRLHLARGLVANPPVLLLDEPTVGMDPIAAHEFRALVADLRTDRRTILLTTHDMAEAEALCDRITLLDSGKVVTTDTPRAVAGWLAGHQRIEAHHAPAGLDELLVDLPGVARVVRQPNGDVYIDTVEAAATKHVLNSLLALDVTQLSIQPPRLEDAYLRMFRREGMAVPE